VQAGARIVDTFVKSLKRNSFIVCHFILALAGVVPGNVARELLTVGAVNQLRAMADRDRLTTEQRAKFLFCLPKEKVFLLRREDFGPFFKLVGQLDATLRLLYRIFNRKAL
jgi:hypothetical protein